VSSSKLRGVLDERTSDQRRRRRRSERRFEIIRSFGDFSRSGSARLSFCSTREQQQQQQSKKKRETFERKARGFKRDQSHLQISFAASFCVFLAGGSSVKEVFFLEKDARSEKRGKKEKKKYRLDEKKDNTATTEQRQKSQHSSLALYSSLVYVVYK